MLFVSGQSPNLSLTHRVYDFFSEIYEVSADVEVCHTDLSDDDMTATTDNTNIIGAKNSDASGNIGNEKRKNP